MWSGRNITATWCVTCGRTTTGCCGSELVRNRPDVTGTKPPKPIRHHQPSIKDLHQKLLNLHGVDVTTLSGITDYTLLQLAGETGIEMHRFPTAKHFVSRCQLSPRNNQSGKTNRNIRVQNKSRAGQIFRQAAQSLLQSKYTAIGAFMRRIKNKRGAPVAIKAGARKIATAYYNIITKGVQYVESGIQQYEERLKSRELKLLDLLARKHNAQLVFS